MAFKWKYPKPSSTLDEDLEISSSDEEAEDILRLPEDEDDLLRTDDEAATSEPTATSSTPYYIDTSASVQAKEAGQQTNTGVAYYASNSVIETNTNGATGEIEDLEDGEIAYEEPPAGTLSTSSTDKNNQKKSIFDDMDLDEICRQRNIIAPPRAPRYQPHHRFHHDRPITGARSKFYNIDPKQNLSLDEIIKMIPPAGPDHQAIRRRHHFTDGNWRSSHHQHQHNQQTDKLKKGVETIAENHPEQEANIFKEAIPNLPEQFQQGTSNQVPEGSPADAWHCVSILINKGYSIYWSLMVLKNCEYLTEDQESRLYRCIVSYNHVQGICEAGNPMQAKHGAAANFLEKLTKEFPLIGKFESKVNEAILLAPSLLTSLITKLQEKHGDGYRFRCYMQSQKFNNRIFYKCNLHLESFKYEACSYFNARSAKLMAAKMAYEDLLKERCPMQKIHLGMEQCTGDPSHYRGVESQMVHCYDFSRVTIIDPETVRTTMHASKRPFPTFQGCGSSRYGKSIPISFLGPLTTSN